MAYGIVLVYVLTSGVSAVGWTNTFQGIFMLVIASMSTGDALLHAGASVAVEDGIRPFRELDDRRRRLLMSGLVGGAAVTLFFFFQGHLRPFDLHEGILGLLVHSPVLLGVSLLTRDPEPDRAKAFIRAAGGPGGAVS